MIQELGDRKFDNQYRPGAVPCDDDYVFAFDHGIYVRVGEDDIEVPTYREFKELGYSVEDVRYLFAIDDRQFFLLNDEVVRSCSSAPKDGKHFGLPEGYAFENMRAIRKCTPTCMAGMTANHLAAWYRDNRYCGRCKGEMVHDDTLRCVRCSVCGREVFPRINPAVIVGIRNGNKLLTSKYANRPQSNGRALLAGFCEIGETAEETVAREVMEEVGLKVKNIQYYASQPWGFAGNLSIGYFCDLDGDDTITLDENELACAEFTDRDKLPEPDNFVSLTATMIEEFRRGNW